MRNFIKLFNFELNRFMKWYITLLIIIFSAQLAVVVLQATSYMRFVKETITDSRITPEQFIETYWSFSLMEVVTSIGFYAPIFLGVGGLLFYMLFIWYRDWFARHTFIYRLLMLPTSRMTIYAAKLATVLVTVLGMVAMQLLYLVIFKQIIQWIVPLPYRIDLSLGFVIETSEYLNVFIPSSVSEFFIAYALGTAFVILVFTAILFERSFQFIGSIIGVFYIIFMISLFMMPSILQLIFFGSFYLYANEMFVLQSGLTIVLTGISLWISYYLLNKKVTV